MSHVTNVIVAFGLSSCEAELITRMNELIPHNEHRKQGLEHLNPTEQYGGTKVLEVNLAIAAFNYLDFDGWIEELKNEDWSIYDCMFIQVMVQGQDNDGFGSVKIWDDGRMYDPGNAGSTLDYPG